MTEKRVAELAKQWLGFDPRQVVKLPGSGSDRTYFRLTGDRETIIATYSDNEMEAKRFIYLSRYFLRQNLPVPEILGSLEDGSVYFQTDLGHKGLLDMVLEKGHCTEVFDLYKQSLKNIIGFHRCSKQPDFQEEFEKLPLFDGEQVLYDLNYFEKYFLRVSGMDYNREKLQGEFEALSGHSVMQNERCFMYRDLQGRNIMVHEGKVCFIDYQGGMQGFGMYDVASLLWQAKAELPESWRKELFEYYLQESGDERGTESYAFFVLLRLLQVLGAYGLRGLIERKDHFIRSIPSGLRNISEWYANNDLKESPELGRCLAYITDERFISKFQ